MNWVYAITSLLLCILTNTFGTGCNVGATLPKIKVRDDGFFVDNTGRVRIFHGFNEVYKAFPWYVDHLNNLTMIKYFKEWGFNAVRLGTMWSGVEPSKGQFNETYLSILKAQVQRLADHGLYSFLDMHQDVLSERFGTYDGAPSWLVDLLPKARDPYPFPWNSTKPFYGGNWALQYLTEGCCVSFQGLYDNVNNATDYLVDFWRKVAQTFKDSSSVLGYELINEPWAGNVYGNPFLLEPGEAGKRNLFPMYEKIAKGIREIDNETIIMYEPVTWGVLFNGPDSGSGFVTVPGGPDYRDRSALSYHLYCWIMTGNLHDPIKYWQKVVCDDILAEKLISNAREEYKKTGGGGFLTEFGNCEPDGSKNSSNTVLCETAMNVADKYFTSWTYWDNDFFTSDGKLLIDNLKPFVRAYPRAIAGTPLLMSFDVDRYIMDFEYELDPKIKEPTEIFVPPLHYPKGFKVTTSANVVYKFDDNNHVLLISPKQSVTDSENVSVNIVPKL